jgi:flagellar biosynthesis/type III secretory pathway chaperone
MTATSNTNPAGQGINKDSSVKMIAATIILGVILAFLVIMYFVQRHNMNEMETVLTEEKDSLANELRRISFAFDTLKTNNDTLNANLARDKEKIVKILAINESNVRLIRQYKKEIKTMREIMKSYIVQIDSLNSRNKMLVAENSEIRQEIKEVRSTNTELSKAKNELTSKVEVASVIQAKDITAVPLNKKRKETNRVGLLDKLRICFTLRENPIAKAGQKVVYLRVIRPDSLIIATSPDNLFEYKKNKIIYSANREVDYMNQDIDMCIFLDNTGDFIIGNYSAELYLEGTIIGRTSFILSKK